MITGILFDKDGTLFDFHATWGSWAQDLLLDLAKGNIDRAASLGTALGFDMETGEFAADSPVIAHTPHDIALALLPQLPGKSLAALVSQMNGMAANVMLAPAVPLSPLLGRLRAQGFRLGVATNDAEAATRVQLASIGILDHFDFVAGFDSGFGGKPAPGMMQAFTHQFSLDAKEVLMVGDSRHDLIAGRAAGMRTVAVLTGLADEHELAPLADAVLPDIGHLPEWIDALARVEC